MNTPIHEPPPVLVLLAHEVRWKLLRALALSDYRVQELVELVGRPLNLVSYHLRQLRQHQLVTEHRSSADGRDVYYHLTLRSVTQAGGLEGCKPSTHPFFSSRGGATPRRVRKRGILGRRSLPKPLDCVR